MTVEKTLRKKVEYDEAELADMATDTVLSERDKEDITVHIPEDAVGLVEALEKHPRPLRGGMDGVLCIKTESRPPGFIQVETEEGIVNASPDIQLDNLKEQLMALNSREQDGKYMELDQIRRAIENAGPYTYLGKIDKIVGTIVESMGPVCRLGGVCTIDVAEGGPSVIAEVVGFRENKVLLMPYEGTKEVGYGSAVRDTEERLHIAVSNYLIGGAVDTMDNFIDDLRLVEDVPYYSITGRPSNPMIRSRIDTIIQMGARAIDGLMTVGKGQRMGIFAGSGAGKSILVGMVAKNVKADVNVIILVGEGSREVVEFTHRDLGEGGLRRSVLVVATSNRPAIIHSKCTMTVTTITEYFKDRGMDVLPMMDPLTRFAVAQREVGLSIEEPPVAKGYTPSIYSELSKLLERSDNFEGGSITDTYTALAEGDDAGEPISDTVRGIIDEHIMLSRKVAVRDHYPAINILSSVSRLMNDIVTPEHKTATGKL